MVQGAPFGPTPPGVGLVPQSPAPAVRAACHIQIMSPQEQDESFFRLVKRKNKVLMGGFASKKCGQLESFLLNYHENGVPDRPEGSGFVPSDPQPVLHASCSEATRFLRARDVTLKPAR